MLRFTLTAFLVIPLFTMAQSPIDKVYEKYAGQERFTSVNFSREMFQMFQQMIGDKTDTSALEMKKMMEQLTGLKVLSYSIDSNNMTKAVAIYNEFAGLFPASQYKEIMTVNEGRESYKFMTRQEVGGKVNEMVMLMKGKNEVALICLTGNIDLSSISKLSKGMNIKGMEKLQKMKDTRGK